VAFYGSINLKFGFEHPFTPMGFLLAEEVEESKYGLLLRLEFQLPWYCVNKDGAQLENMRWGRDVEIMQKEKLDDG